MGSECVWFERILYKGNKGINHLTILLRSGLIKYLRGGRRQSRLRHSNFFYSLIIKFNSVVLRLQPLRLTFFSYLINEFIAPFPISFLWARAQSFFSIYANSPAGFFCTAPFLRNCCLSSTIFCSLLLSLIKTYRKLSVRRQNIRVRLELYLKSLEFHLLKIQPCTTHRSFLTTHILVNVS